MLSLKQEAYTMELYTHIFFLTPKVIAIVEKTDKPLTNEFMLEVIFVLTKKDGWSVSLFLTHVYIIWQTTSMFHEYYSKKYLTPGDMKASEYLLSLLNGVQLVLLSGFTWVTFFIFPLLILNCFNLIHMSFNTILVYRPKVHILQQYAISIKKWIKLFKPIPEYHCYDIEEALRYMAENDLAKRNESIKVFFFLGSCIGI